MINYSESDHFPTEFSEHFLRQIWPCFRNIPKYPQMWLIVFLMNAPLKALINHRQYYIFRHFHARRTKMWPNHARISDTSRFSRQIGNIIKIKVIFLHMWKTKNQMQNIPLYCNTRKKFHYYESNNKFKAKKGHVRYTSWILPKISYGWSLWRLRFTYTFGQDPIHKLHILFFRLRS